MRRRRRFYLRERTRESLRLARAELRNRPRPRKLSEEVASLHSRFAEGPLTLGEMVTVLQGRAWTLVLVLLALPFTTPIPLPFLSTPFGVAIALISLRLALGQRPWLPASLLLKRLPPGFFGKLLRFSAGVLRVMEKVLRPRWSWLAESPVLVRMHALAMLCASIVLLLPIPVPFTNTFPAWLILLVAGGLLERDGVVVSAGYAVGAGGLVFFYYLGNWAVQLAQRIQEWAGF